MSQYFMLALITVAAVALLSVGYRFFSAAKTKRFREKLDARFGAIPVREDIDELKFDSVSAYWYEKVFHEDAEHSIDEITWSDLDMDEVFARIDACHTSVGEEFLYAALHEPVGSGERLNQREELMALFESDPTLRLDLQALLSKMGKSDYSGLSSFCYDVTSKKLKNRFIYRILMVLPFLFLASIFISPAIGIFGVLASITVNGTIYYKVTLDIAPELKAIRYFSVLMWCANQIVTRISKSDVGAFAAPDSTAPADSSPTPDLTASADSTPPADSPPAANPIVRDLARAYEIFKKQSGSLGNLSSVGQQKMSEAESLIEYFRIVTLSNIRHYNKIIGILEKNTAEFRALYTSLGEIDMAVSVLSYRKSLPFFTRPDFIPAASKNRLIVRDIYHPLLKHPVCNTASITRNSLVSGSNASGKSTFIKALAVNAITAQTIHTCCAKAFQTRFALVLSSMAIRDDITSGDSYFIAEIKSLKRIIDRIGRTNCICIIDEILRGTNTIERIAASTAVLKRLSELDCLCIVATHDVELTALLASSYENYHFSERVTDAGVVFDYTIKPGSTQTKNAITLLDYLGYDPQIIAAAKEYVGNFEETGRWERLPR